MDGPIYHLENVLRGKREETSDFVGPLDLILHLLGKNKLEIRDIPVAQILDQYMDWVSTRREMDLEVASEFIAMAAHLLYIKTRMLLSAQDEEALSEMEQLIASLEARQRNEDYQRIKLGIPQMELLYQRGSAYLSKPPEPRPSGRRFQYSHRPEELMASLNRLAQRSRRRLPPPIAVFQGVVGREPYPVEQKVSELLARLRESASISLHSLWRESRSRSEVVAVFISVLELCRTGQICLTAEEGSALFYITEKQRDCSA